jgi:hypothetical protein
MNKFGKLFLFVFMVLMLVGCSAPAALAQPLVGLPDEAHNLIFILLTAAVTWVLLKLSIVFKIDLSGYAGMVAAGLAPILVAIIEKWLALIPSTFDSIVLTIIHLIVLLVGSLGTFWLFQRKAAPSLRK